MLEGINGSRINVHNLTIPGPRPELPEWQKHFNFLKDTPLYDRGLEFWNRDLTPFHLTPSFGRLYSTPQLAALLIEARIDPAETKKNYGYIKGTPLFDSRVNVWNDWWEVTENKSPRVYKDTEKALLDIWVQSYFDKDSAKQGFDKAAKNSRDPKSGFWSVSTTEEDKMVLTEIFTNIQLTAALVEEAISPGSLKSRYQDLRKGGFYKSDQKLWYRSFGHLSFPPDPASEPDSFFPFSTQMLAVTAEAQFDAEAAAVQMEYVKKLYQVEDQKFFGINIKVEDLTLDKEVLTQPQLYYVLALSELERRNPQLKHQIPEIPKIRRFRDA